jgi:hypothetical protein
MTRRIDGRGFSRRERREVTIEELAAELMRSPWLSFAERIDRLADNARKVLEDRDLPSTYIVDCSAENDGRFAACCLDHYIARRGYARDSLEDFAARIIVTRHRLGEWPAEQREELAFKLGELATLVRVYGITLGSAAKGGAKSERKAWAVEMMRELRERYAGESIRGLFKRLPTDDGDSLVGCSVWRDRKFAYWRNNETGEEDQISRRSLERY